MMVLRKKKYFRAPQLWYCLSTYVCREEWISCIRNFLSSRRAEERRRRRKRVDIREKDDEKKEEGIVKQSEEMHANTVKQIFHVFLSVLHFTFEAHHPPSLLLLIFIFSLSSIFFCLYSLQHHKVSIGFPQCCWCCSLFPGWHSYSRMKRRRRKGNNQQHAKLHQMTPHSQDWRMIMMMMTIIISSSYSCRWMLRGKNETANMDPNGAYFCETFLLSFPHLDIRRTVTYGREGDLFKHQVKFLSDDCCPVGSWSHNRMASSLKNQRKILQKW